MVFLREVELKRISVSWLTTITLARHQAVADVERFSYSPTREQDSPTRWDSAEAARGRSDDTWEQFERALAQLNWPAVEIRKDLNPFRRAEAH